MKFKTKYDITSDKFTALAANDAAIIAEGLNEFCDKFAADLDKEKLVVAEKETKIQELTASVEKANKAVEEIQSKLEKVEKARASEKESNDLSLRLSDLTSRFELSDKGAKAIAKQIKGLDDAKYSEWLEFAESTFAAKKVADTDNDADTEDDDDADDKGDAKTDKKKKKDAKASVEDEDFDFETVEANKNQKRILNSTRGDRDMYSSMKDAFAGWEKELSLE